MVLKFQYVITCTPCEGGSCWVARFLACCRAAAGKVSELQGIPPRCATMYAEAVPGLQDVSTPLTPQHQPDWARVGMSSSTMACATAMLSDAGKPPGWRVARDWVTWLAKMVA